MRSWAVSLLFHVRNCLLLVCKRFLVQALLLAAGAATMLAQKPVQPPALPAVERGIPLLQVFPENVTGGNPQNFAVIQDHRGILYVANSYGVLEFDGRTWRQITLPNLSGVYSLAVDAEGNVFVGAQNDFGVLRPNQQGQMGYVSLVGLVPEADRQFGNVWKTYATGDGVFFQTFTHIFRYSTGNARPIQIWRPKTQFDIAFNAYDRVFVRQRDIGLMEIVGDSLLLPKFGSAFAEDRIFSMIPYPGDTVRRPILIVSRDKGLFRLDDGDQLRPVEFKASGWLSQNKVYTAASLGVNTRLLVFGSLLGGVLITDLDGDIKYQLTSASGLPDDQVYHTYPDHQGGIWLALNNGLARVEMPAPITRFSDATGLPGVVDDITRYNGNIYAATTKGLFWLQAGWPAGTFKPAGVTQHVRSLLATPQGLLVGTNSDGLKLLRSSAGATQQLAAYRVNRMLRSRQDTNLVYLGLADGMATLRLQAGRWVDAGRVENMDIAVRSMTETADGQLYVTSDANDFRRVTRTPEGKVLAFPNNEDTPWPDESARAALYTVQGGTYVASLDGLYQHVPDQQQFVRASEAGTSPVADSLLAVALYDYRDRGDLWIKGFESYFFGFRQPGGNYRLDPVQQLATVRTEVDNATWIDQTGPFAGTIWLGGFGGLVRFEPEIFRNINRPFKAYIRSVRQQQERLDSVLFGGAYFISDSGRVASTQPQDAIIELPYGFGALRFDFGANNFEGGGATEFQFRLDSDGSTERWGAWTTNGNEDYSNLREGHYTLRVRARNKYGIISQTAVYAFVVLPPWYRTWWAYTGYSLIAVALIYGFIRYRERQLIREKRVLEEKVVERTQELSEQKKVVEQANEEITRQHEQLSEAYHEIEEKNKDITDSITYARRIQEALLPVQDELQRLLPNNFVLNRPRDIVSGDFYWISEKFDPAVNQQCIVLAVVDCTGHGVPGAFMSIMGSTLLNQIVGEAHILHPSAILTEMDDRIRQLLRQDDTSSSSKDGMDLALCVLYPQQGRIRFAGGRRPLFWVKNGELIEIQGRKYGIGGRPQEDPFETHEIAYNQGDMVYLSTDGYADQFGGPNRRKFMVPKFKDLLVEEAPKPTTEQLARLTTEHIAWKGELDQVDDILVVGVRL